MPNKYTFNKSEIDAPDFLPGNKDKKRFQKIGIQTLELDKYLIKTQEKTKI